jgi:hypothetical protein
MRDPCARGLAWLGLGWPNSDSGGGGGVGHATQRRGRRRIARWGGGARVWRRGRPM